MVGKKGTLPCLNVGEGRVELYGKNGDFFLKFLNQQKGQNKMTLVNLGNVA